MNEPRLKVLVGRRELTITSPVDIGSDPGAAIQLDETGVSRAHARLEWVDGRWVLVDTGSRNGTYHQGRRIERLEVIGRVTVRLAHPQQGPELTLEPDQPPATLVSWPGGRRELAPPGPVRIGRDPDADIVVDAEGVSRRHAELRWTGSGWELVDVGSRNGTFVDGARIERRALSGRTAVRLGHPQMGEEVVIAVAGPAPAPPPARPAAGRARQARPVTRPVAEPSARSVGMLREVSQVYRPPTGTVKVGRAPDNDIVLEDLVVSRYHAELRGDPVGGFELVDLGSFNGTFVNGTQAERVRLVEGDVVGVGHHRLRLVAGQLEEYVDTGDVSFQAHDLWVRTPAGLDILQGVTFALAERSLMAVVGPSGAGKSTLLNALTGFRPAQSGSVLYDGRDLYAAYDDLRQRIGYVPQDDILHVQLTIRQALEFAATLRFPPDVGDDQREERVEEVMAELGLSHRADVPIHQLSGGQRKRASVAIELLTKPSLLFLDEPTSGLDPGYERSLTRLLRELADGGRTVVVVTHSVQSLDLCDRVIFLATGGRTAFFGPADEVTPYFGKGSYAEVFETLEGDKDEDWRGRYESHPAYARYVAEPLEEAAADAGDRRAARPQRRRGGLRQYFTLTRRYLAVMASDRKVILLLALQAPVLGLLMLVAMPADELAPSASLRLSQATAVLAVLIVAVTGLGISNAIREIVKEAPIYQRERAVGLSIPAYVASKATVLAVITAVQAVVLVLIAIQRQRGDWGVALFEPAQLELAVGFAAAGIAAMATALFLSALSKSAERVMSLLPVLLIIQLVLSGAFQNVLRKPVLREASYLATAQWGFASGAATVDLNSLQVLNDCLATEAGVGGVEQAERMANCVVVNQAEAQGRTPEDVAAQLVGELGLTPAEAEALVAEAQADAEAGGDPPLRFWEQEPRDWLINVGVLVGFTALGLWGAAWALKRKDPQLLQSE